MKQLITECPDGKRILSCGWSALDSTSAIMEGQATYSEPSFDGKNWMVNVKLTSTYNPEWKLRTRCVCAEIDEPVKSLSSGQRHRQTTGRSARYGSPAIWMLTSGFIVNDRHEVIRIL